MALEKAHLSGCNFLIKYDSRPLITKQVLGVVILHGVEHRGGDGFWVWRDKSTCTEVYCELSISIPGQNLPQ